MNACYHIYREPSTSVKNELEHSLTTKMIEMLGKQLGLQELSWLRKVIPSMLSLQFADNN